MINYILYFILLLLVIIYAYYIVEYCMIYYDIYLSDNFLKKNTIEVENFTSEDLNKVYKKFNKQNIMAKYDETRQDILNMLYNINN